MSEMSAKVVGWEIHERESAAYAAALVQRAVLAEGGIDRPLVLHADNGSAQNMPGVKNARDLTLYDLKKGSSL